MASKPSAKPADKTVLNASYDEVPYESYTYPLTHPEHLSVVGTLFGLTPPDFRGASVLEIGCAAGGNLFPQALAYPKAKFTGIDFSAEQITLAQEQKKAMGVTNVEFRHEDILNFDLKKNKDKFDFIIAHGIFSWVPEPVREKLLAICGACLSKEGLAIVSYNTLPGWNAVRSLREMMLFHTGRFTNPKEKIAQSRALLDFLADNVPEASAGYRKVIEHERELLKTVNDTYLYHDHLESVNAQFYFHDFARMANAHGLAYVGDASFTSMFVENMPPKAAETLKALNDVVAQEQYMDFINNRRFRSSILCRDGAKLNRNLRAEQILDYNLVANFGPKTEKPDPAKDIVFKAATGVEFTTHDAPTGEICMELVRAASQGVPGKDLPARVAAKLKSAAAKTVQDTLLKNGLTMVLRGWLTLRLDAPKFTIDISKKPVVYPLARYQAGKGSNRVTNVLHTTVQTGDIVNTILRNLDGTRTVADIVVILTEGVKKGDIKVAKENKPVTDPKEIKASLEQIVTETLPKLAAQGLLVG